MDAFFLGGRRREEGMPGFPASDVTTQERGGDERKLQ